MKSWVILCAHNGVRHLEEQLVSICTQDRPVDHVHLFDFASSDGSADLADRLALRWPQITVERVPDAPGVTLSFFHAFREIGRIAGESDAIFLSDQDDVWKPNKSAAMLDLFETQFPASPGGRLLLFHDVEICDESLAQIKSSHYDGRPFRLPRDLAPERLLVANPVIGHSMLTTGSLLKLASDRLRPERYLMHDWALVLLAAHFGQIGFHPGQLGYYRQHDANLLGVARSRSLLSQIGRAARLARGVDRQTRAFLDDLVGIEDACGTNVRAEVLPGRATGFGLGLHMLRHGVSLRHRSMALFQFADSLFGKPDDRTSGRLTS
ncbi:glycosyltransferase [Sandaracinobacteroides hominis]|uniref:glycosyltransferase n=1 Tax=Sandaracinobacteroides hominis TaxID=2780086 RepID=UPI0018F75E87|nr:glycosyltransferase [Sandaracinobacteroides hominis]